jgi:histidinol dehydrogenase
VLVIADATAKASYVAADLLAQAEHGSGDECALLLTPSRRLAAAVQAEIARQLPALPRAPRGCGGWDRPCRSSPSWRAIRHTPPPFG